MNGHIHGATRKASAEQMKFKQEMISNWFFSAFLWFNAFGSVWFGLVRFGWVAKRLPYECTSLCSSIENNNNNSRQTKRIEFAFRLTTFKYRISYKFLFAVHSTFRVRLFLSLFVCVCLCTGNAIKILILFRCYKMYSEQYLIEKQHFYGVHSIDT